jgi:N-methylhydantoinase A
LLQTAGVAFDGTAVQFELDMSYQGQTHTVDVVVPLDLNGETTGVTEALVRAAFETRYLAVYGRLLDNIAIRVLNLRVSALGKRPKFDLTLLAPAAGVDLAQARRGTRQVWFDGGFHETGVYERLPLSVGQVVPGPALLEQPDATIFIEPDLTGRVDHFGNLVLARKQEDIDGD